MPRTGSPITAIKHFHMLDGIRGIAAMAVVLFHLNGHDQLGLLTAEFESLGISRVLNYGSGGVPVFFVLSGFVISYSLRKSAVEGIDLPNFMGRRLLRITPPYYAAILVALLLAYGASLNRGTEYTISDYPFSFERLASHLVYLQEVLGFENFNDVFWTLGIELQFYLILGVVIWLAFFISQRGFSNSQNILKALYLVSGVVSLAWPFGILGSTERAVYSLPLCYSFFLGVLVHEVYRKFVPLWSFVLYWALIVVAMIVNDHDFLFKVVAVGTSLLILIALRFDLLNVLFADQISQFLGKISYSLYLIHTPVAGAVLVLVNKLGEPSVLLQTVGFVAAIFVSILVSAIFYKMVESPSIGLSRSLSKVKA